MVTLALPRLEPTTPLQREILRCHGFVHVTGLTLIGPEPGMKRVIGTTVHLVPGYQTDKGMSVIVTWANEVWLAHSHTTSPDFARLLNELHLGTSYGYVPCADEREQIPIQEYAARVTMPDWNMPYRP